MVSSISGAKTAIATKGSALGSAFPLSLQSVAGYLHVVSWCVFAFSSFSFGGTGVVFSTPRFFVIVSVS